MMKLLRNIVVFVVAMPIAYSSAQDLHFSQFFNTPLTTSPANTGFIPDADYRIGVHYRNQWSSIMSVPYITMSAFADAQVLREKLDNGWLGIGAVVLNDKAGSGSLQSTKIYGSIAYFQMLGMSSLLSAGFNLGWANKRIDPTSLKFPDQFDGHFFDNSLPTSVVLTNTSVSYFDMQVGMNYAYFPQENTYISAGYSLLHVNRPKESFFADRSADAIIPLRHIGFVNALLKVNPNVIINPNVYFTTQANSMELTGGMIANINLANAGEKQLIAGAYYRVGDAIIPMVGLEISHIRLSFTYDVTTSDLRNYNNYRGASEFNLIKNGFYPDNPGKQVLCPKF